MGVLQQALDHALNTQLKLPNFVRDILTVAIKRRGVDATNAQLDAAVKLIIAALLDGKDIASFELGTPGTNEDFHLSADDMNSAIAAVSSGYSTGIETAISDIIERFPSEILTGLYESALMRFNDIVGRCTISRSGCRSSGGMDSIDLRCFS